MGYLHQHLLAHTNGRMGLTFSNQEIDVVEVVEFEGEIVVEPVLEAEITVDSEEEDL